MQTLLRKSGEMQEARALVEQISKITKRAEAFDVDVRWARALMDGDRSLEQITASTQRRSPARACVKFSKKSRQQWNPLWGRTGNRRDILACTFF